MTRPCDTVGLPDTDEHAVGLGHLERDLLELLGIGVGVFDGGALGPRNTAKMLPWSSTGASSLLSVVKQKIARAGHGQADQKHERPHRERTLQKRAIAGGDRRSERAR